MSTPKYVELSRYVHGERFKYTFKGDCKQYIILLTNDESGNKRNKHAIEINLWQQIT